MPCPPWDLALKQFLFAAPGSCRYLWILKLLLPAAKDEFWILGGRLVSLGGAGRAPRWLPARLPLSAATALVPVLPSGGAGGELIAGTRINQGGKRGSCRTLSHSGQPRRSWHVLKKISPLMVAGSALPQ